MLAQNIQGDWYGKIDLGVAGLPIQFTIDKDGSNYTAILLSKHQGNVPIPVESVSLQDSVLTINVPNLNFVYNGIVKSDSEIEGSMTQFGQKLTLNLSRNEDGIKRPQEPIAPFPYKSEEVTFKNDKDNITLSGTLTLPTVADGVKSPAVVLIAGSGPLNRNEELFEHKPFAVIADYFTRNGIAVLRYDKRGVGQSDGNFGTSTTFDFADDAQTAFNFLKNRDEINVNKVGILGHSEGALIAFILGSRLDDLSFAISLAGSGVRGDSLLLRQAEDVFKTMDIPVSEYEPMLDLNRQIFAIINKSEDTDTIKNNIKKLFEGNKNTKSESIELQMESVASPWMLTFLKYDPKDDLQKVTCPVLVLNGDRDVQVAADINLNAIKEALEANGNKKVTVKNYENLNHLFQKCTTCAVSEYGELEETFNVEVLEDMKDWILSLN